MEEWHTPVEQCPSRCFGEWTERQSGSRDNRRVVIQAGNGGFHQVGGAEVVQSAQIGLMLKTEATRFAGRPEWRKRRVQDGPEVVS